MKRLVTWATLAALALPAAAREQIERQIEAAADGHVSIEFTDGDITVHGWDEPRVSISGSIRGGGELEVERDGDGIRIEESGPHPGRSAVDLEIRVPRRSELQIELVSGDLRLQDLAGRIEAVAVSGDVEAAVASARMSIEAVSGDVRVRNGAPLTRGEFESVSGDVEVETALSDGAELDLESVSGDLRLGLRGEIDARIQAETGPGGDIENGLNGERPDRERYVGSESLELRLGNGNADIELSVVTGRIRLERK